MTKQEVLRFLQPFTEETEVAVEGGDLLYKIDLRYEMSGGVGVVVITPRIGQFYWKP